MVTQRGRPSQVAQHDMGMPSAMRSRDEPVCRTGVRASGSSRHDVQTRCIVAHPAEQARMMMTLYLGQALLPPALIAVLWRFPAASRVGFGAQCAGSAVALAAIALRGVWLLPPWCAPHAFAVTLAAVVPLALRRRRPFPSTLPVTSRGWISCACFAALGGASLPSVLAARDSRTPPATTGLELAFPLPSGRYLVVNGGSDIATNAHLLTLDAESPRLRAWRGQSLGVDLVRVDTYGLRAAGVQPADPRAYRIHGTRVLAPCDGTVIALRDGLPDMSVPKTDRAHLAGNHVLLRCNGGDVLLGHLGAGTLRVHADTTARTGDWLGNVGNSGNSDEPHLHSHAQRPGPANAPMAGEPLPILFGDRFPVRSDLITVP